MVANVKPRIAIGHAGIGAGIVWIELYGFGKHRPRNAE